MKISREQVEHVAVLARLELNKEEIERMTVQLDNILSYVAKLDELDTEKVPASTHSQDISNAFREDEVSESLDREKALANGPRQNGELFIVPRIIS